jgi:hypothetical protein
MKHKVVLTYHNALMVQTTDDLFKTHSVIRQGACAQPVSSLDGTLMFADIVSLIDRTDDMDVGGNDGQTIDGSTAQPDSELDGSASIVDKVKGINLHTSSPLSSPVAAADKEIDVSMPGVMNLVRADEDDEDFGSHKRCSCKYFSAPLYQKA